jgi:TfoX/Sxy family transcriptional regulator of competence genes
MEAVMAYDDVLAQRISKILEGTHDLVEKKMFGGVGYLIQGNMACGVNKEDLIIRVGPEAYEQALKQPHVRVFDMTGRPMKGWITVSPNGYQNPKDLEAWIQRGMAFVKSLPPK